MEQPADSLQSITNEFSQEVDFLQDCEAGRSHWLGTKHMNRQWGIIVKKSLMFSVKK